jgi:hypothetical protein
MRNLLAPIVTQISFGNSQDGDASIPASVRLLTIYSIAFMLSFAVTLESKKASLAPIYTTKRLSCGLGADELERYSESWSKADGTGIVESGPVYP